VDISDHGLVCGNGNTDSGCDVVWTTVAEGLDELLSVSDGELNIEILECQGVCCFREVCR
jgi:hypothetical protein